MAVVPPVFPLLPLAVYAGVRGLGDRNAHCWIVPIEGLEWVINLPPLLAILVGDLYPAVYVCVGGVCMCMYVCVCACVCVCFLMCVCGWLGQWVGGCYSIRLYCIALFDAPYILRI